MARAISSWIRATAGACALMAMGGAHAPASAQGAPDMFYAGKNLRVVIGFGPGGGYDRWARIVGRHMARLLPGQPTFVPQNMPGAGSLTALNYIATAAPRDGTVIGLVTRDAPMAPLAGIAQARFDARTLSWIGTPTRETNVCIVHSKAKVKDVAGAMTQDVVLGETGPGASTHIYPVVLREFLGLRFKMIAGFQSSAQVFMAMERGEVDGICESLDSINSRQPRWIPDKVVTVLLHSGEQGDAAVAGSPSVYSLARTDEQRAALKFIYAGQDIGRPFVGPPGLAPERLKQLRDAFDATMKDAEFIEEARRNLLDVAPETGAQLDALIRDIYATPKAVVDRVGALIAK